MNLLLKYMSIWGKEVFRYRKQVIQCSYFMHTSVCLMRLHRMKSWTDSCPRCLFSTQMDVYNSTFQALKEKYNNRSIFSAACCWEQPQFWSVQGRQRNAVATNAAVMGESDTPPCASNKCHTYVWHSLLAQCQHPFLSTTNDCFTSWLISEPHENQLLTWPWPALRTQFSFLFMFNFGPWTAVCLNSLPTLE